MTKQRLSKIAIHICALLVGILIAVPFFWMISTSFKSKGSLINIPIEWVPKKPTIEAYLQIFSIENFTSSILNSLYLAVVTTAVQLLSAAMAAYAFAKISFRGREKLFRVYLASMMIPFQVIFIPLFILMSGLKLTNSLNAFLLLQLFNAFAIFMLRQKMMSISDSFIDAAVIDGASEFTIFFRIIIPLSSGVIATLAIMTFMGSWNDYLFPLVMLSDRSKFTLPLILSSLNGQYGTRYNLLMAGALISILPILVLYMFTQRFFKSGLQVGGIKA